MKKKPGLARAEGEHLLHNIFIPSDCGLYPPYAGIFFTWEFNFHNAQPQVFEKSGYVSQLRKLTANVKANLALCEREHSPIKLAL